MELNVQTNLANKSCLGHLKYIMLNFPAKSFTEFLGKKKKLTCAQLYACQLSEWSIWFLIYCQQVLHPCHFEYHMQLLFGGPFWYCAYPLWIQHQGYYYQRVFLTPLPWGVDFRQEHVSFERPSSAICKPVFLGQKHEPLWVMLSGWMPGP